MSLYIYMKSPLLRKVLLSAFGLSALLIINGCGKASSGTTPGTLATITTNGLIANVTTTGAQSGGILTYNGGVVILASGVCYSSSSQTPTVANSKTVDSISYDPAGTEAFYSKITGLTPGTTYYLRAYATNSAGTAYGDVIKFTTSTTLTAINTTVTTLAGSGVAGYAEGQGTGAMFYNPQGVTTDPSGNVYVADGFNNRIRKITPGGLVSTFAGNGYAGFSGGPGATAEFYAPQAVASDPSGNIYVCDFGNNVIRKITPAGVVSTFAGNGLQGYVNGADTVAEFNSPQGVTIDKNGYMFVADRGTVVIRKMNTAKLVTTFAGTPGVQGFYNATGTAAEFNTPNDVTSDPSGNIYVADLGNHAIREMTQASVVTTFAGGPVQSTLLGSPTSIASDAKGNIYVSDQTGRILEITTTNILYVLAGSFNTSGYVDGAGTAARFNNPQGIAVDASGNVYVADYGNNVIRKITGAIQ